MTSNNTANIISQISANCKILIIVLLVPIPKKLSTLKPKIHTKNRHKNPTLNRDLLQDLSDYTTKFRKMQAFL